MAYVISRGLRFTGYYRDRHGHRHSAGTFDSKDEALKQATSVEQSGVIGGLQTNLTLQAYIERWLPKADLLPLTKKNYESVLRTHVLPILGRKRVGQITRVNVREMLDTLRQDGIGSATRVQAKSALGSALEDLVELDQLEVNPTHGIKVKKLETNELRNVLEPTEFKDILQNLQSPTARLFASFLALSGARFGEATELRVKDLNLKTNEIYLQRRVNDLGGKHNRGSRFRVIEATKSGHSRAVVVAEDLATALEQHVKSSGLQKNDLLFSKALVTAKPDLKTTVVNTSGHLPRDTWRRLWVKAIEETGLVWSPRTHDIRHANATALLKNGVDLHEVKERLGHQSIRTTERYLHRIRAQRNNAGEAVSEFM